MADHCNHNHPDFDDTRQPLTRSISLYYIVEQFKYRFPNGQSFIVKPDPANELTIVDMDGLIFECQANSDDDEWVFVNHLTGLIVEFPFEPELPRDENGVVVDDKYWLKHCHDDMGSDGQRITCARALQIASDMMLARLDGTTGDWGWTVRDSEIALGVIAAMRLQRGVMGPDAEALGHGDDGLYMTRQCDIHIYG